MSYIHDPEMVDLFGGQFKETRAVDDRGRWLTTPHRQTGLWCNVDVPRTGWTCVRVRRWLPKTRDEPLPVCEMCEVTRIQWVHTMRHPEHPITLECGCVCAGIMAQDMEGAQRNEKYAKAVERARKRHAIGIDNIKATVIGARQSDWDDAVWSVANGLEDEDEDDVTPGSDMDLEIAGHWMRVYERGPGRFGAAAGRKNSHGTKARQPFKTVSEAKAACINQLATLMRRTIDAKLAAVIASNKVVNEFGDVVELG